MNFLTVEEKVDVGKKNLLKIHNLEISFSTEHICV